MKCGDCGQEVGEQKHSGRRNIYDGCRENRGWLIKNGVMIGDKAFQEVQRSMRNRRGTAKRRIEALKRETRGSK